MSSKISLINSHWLIDRLSSKSNPSYVQMKHWYFTSRGSSAICVPHSPLVTHPKAGTHAHR